jgi:hypothetical protein
LTAELYRPVVAAIRQAASGRQEHDMEREIQACADALMTLGRGRNGERLEDEGDEYAHACASAAQVLMAADTAQLAEATKRLAGR